MSLPHPQRGARPETRRDDNTAPARGPGPPRALTGRRATAYRRRDGVHGDVRGLYRRKQAKAALRHLPDARVITR